MKTHIIKFLRSIFVYFHAKHACKWVKNISENSPPYFPSPSPGKMLMNSNRRLSSLKLPFRCWFSCESSVFYHHIPAVILTASSASFSYHQLSPNYLSPFTDIRNDRRELMTCIRVRSTLPRPIILTDA